MSRRRSGSNQADDRIFQGDVGGPRRRPVDKGIRHTLLPVRQRRQPRRHLGHPIPERRIYNGVGRRLRVQREDAIDGLGQRFNFLADLPAGFPVTITCPSLLFRDIDIKKPLGPQKKPPLAPRP